MDLKVLNHLFYYEAGNLYWKIKKGNGVDIDDRAGTLSSNGYIEIKIKGKRYKAHRLIYSIYHGVKIPDDLEIDHINGVRYDNNIDNLRLVTRQHNQFNQVNAKGYSYHKPTNKWVAQIKVNGKKISLGYFAIESEARLAYLKAKEKYHKIKEYKYEKEIL